MQISLLTAKGYRVIALDYIGFGRSDKYVDWKAYTLELHKQSIAQVRKRAIFPECFPFVPVFSAPLILCSYFVQGTSDNKLHLGIAKTVLLNCLVISGMPCIDCFVLQLS